jgi:hypothetical protein
MSSHHQSCKGNLSSAQRAVGRYATEQADTCGAAVGGCVKVGRWDTFKPACKLTKRASATKRAQTVDVKAVRGKGGGGGRGDIKTSELRARQHPAVEVRTGTPLEVRTGTPLVMQLGRPMLTWSRNRVLQVKDMKIK